MLRMLTRSHRCAAPGCPIPVSDSMLGCRRHWYALPANLRTLIFESYRRDAGGTEHRNAVLEAVRIWTRLREREAES